MTYNLSNQRNLLERGHNQWLSFQKNRRLRLAQMDERGRGAEKISELILDELFTNVLDWSKANIDYQSDYCDMILIDTGVKRLLIETKYPGSFHSDSQMQKALVQVNRYAERHNVNKVAVSDGFRLYALDIYEGKACQRVDVYLDGEFPEELWWLSVHGIYRSVPQNVEEVSSSLFSPDHLLHPKHKLPARCFAYVGDANQPNTWSLPYLLGDGSVDTKRLPKAISAIVSNYRGNKAKKIPHSAVPRVLKKLERAARTLRKMPDQRPDATGCYQALAEILLQFSSVNS